MQDFILTQIDSIHEMVGVIYLAEGNQLIIHHDPHPPIFKKFFQSIAISV